MAYEYVAHQYKQPTTLGRGIGRYSERKSGERDNQTFGDNEYERSADALVVALTKSQIIRIWDSSGGQRSDPGSQEVTGNYPRASAAI